MDEATDITLPEQLTRHDFGSVASAGGADALFERHLRFDGAIEPAAAYERQRFRRWPARYATSSRGAGSRPFAPMIRKTPSASTPLFSSLVTA
jgi:hypothetical protein